MALLLVNALWILPTECSIWVGFEETWCSWVGETFDCSEMPVLKRKRSPLLIAQAWCLPLSLHWCLWACRMPANIMECPLCSSWKDSFCNNLPEARWAQSQRVKSHLLQKLVMKPPCGCCSYLCLMWARHRTPTCLLAWKWLGKEQNMAQLKKELLEAMSAI